MPPPGAYERFDPASVREERIVEELDFAAEPTSGGWSVEARRFDFRPAGLVARSGDAVLRIHFARPIPAADVDRIELEASNLAQVSAIDLRWFAADGTTETGSARVFARDALAAAPRVLRFDLAAIPEWSGDVDWLTLQLVGPRGDRPTLHRVRLLATPLDRERLATLADRPWRVEVDDEVRDAYVLAAGAGWRGDLSVEPEAAIRFDIGLLARSAAGIRAWVAFRGARGGELGSEELELASSSALPGRWTRFEAPLQPPRGAVRATLTVDLEPAIGGADALAALAFVEVGTGRRIDPRPDVLLVSIDTLREDRVSLDDGPDSLTPGLAAWAARVGATYFENAYSAAASTLPSHASLLTGRDVLRHGAYGEVPLSRTIPTLAEALAASGYRTAAVTGGGYLHPRYRLDRGFATYRHWPRPPGGRTTDLDDGLRRAAEMLARPSDRPLFLFLHTYDVHGPYRRRGDRLASADRLLIAPRSRGAEGYFDLDRWPVVFEGAERRDLDPSEIPLARALYDEGVRATDERLGNLLQGLRTRGAERQMIVVIVSDHGEALGEDGLWGHGYVTENNLHVPLLVSAPSVPSQDGGGGTRRVSGVVSLADVAPTVLELVGVPVDRGDFDGISLAGALAGGTAPPSDRTVWSYAAESGLGLVAGRREGKLVLRDSILVGETLREHLFDRSDRPLESRDLLADLRAEADRELGRAASGWIVRIDNSNGPAGDLTLASETFAYNNLARVRPGEVRARLENRGRLAIELLGREEILIRHQAAAAELSLEVLLEASGGRWRGASRLLGQAACGRWQDIVWHAASEPPPAGGATATRIQLTYLGPCDGAVPDREDRELEEQLRGLGYLP